MDKRNRYRNPVRIQSVLRMVLVCLLLGVVGGVFVYLRNLHVKTGDKIHAAELAIAELDHELQLWELRIAGAKDRIELARQLKWVGSDLRPIDPARILKIEPSRVKPLSPD
jgi:hypothetical protein